MIDVSSIKELARRWYPRAYFASPAKVGGHRALADILESIAELRYYREAVFVPMPGPDTATAREIAARITGKSASCGPARTARPSGRRYSGIQFCELSPGLYASASRTALRGRPWWA